MCFHSANKRSTVAAIRFRGYSVSNSNNKKQQQMEFIDVDVSTQIAISRNLQQICTQTQSNTLSGSYTRKWLWFMKTVNFNPPIRMNRWTRTKKKHKQIRTMKLSTPNSVKKKTNFANYTLTRSNYAPVKTQPLSLFRSLKIDFKHTNTWVIFLEILIQ